MSGAVSSSGHGADPRRDLPLSGLEYEPLDLAAFCNADSSLLEEGVRAGPGLTDWHGIPFHVASDGGSGARLLAFGDGLRMDEFHLPVGRLARDLIFAHRALDSKVEQGDPVGALCANYVFRFADGEEIVAIREHFEIGVLPSRASKLVLPPVALLAWPDFSDELEPRYEGRWENIGQRLTEVGWGASARDFYLWSWRNPRGSEPVVDVVVRPAGPRCVIGALTVGYLEELPFNRSANRAVKIVLPRQKDAERAFDMSVHVDRGTATYPYPLPTAPVEEFLADDFKGWGEEENLASSPAYVEIAAKPSAIVTVKQDGETLGSFRWGDLEEKQALRPSGQLELILVDQGRNWVRTTVLDDETGRPVPCRIHFRSSDGIPYQPHGHHAHVHSNINNWNSDVGGDVRLGQITYAYIDGRCEGWLPRGDVVVDIARGFEYEPIRQRVSIQPGQQDLVFRLRRVADMRKEGYFAGDTHVHFMSTQGAHLEAAGEGLNVVNLLLTQLGHLFSNVEEFTGRPSVDHGGETIVYASQENRQHILGHLNLLGLKRSVMPWCTGGPGEAELGGNLETTLSRWADACHAQGGTVVVPHFPGPNGEPAALIATGRADAVELITQDSYGHHEYYRYLNLGYRLPLVGGTDKMSSSTPVGIYRTYVHIPDDEQFDYDTWCRHLRGGNTFLSGGPLIRLRVEGQPIGSTISVTGSGGYVEAETSVTSIFPVHSLELVLNGEVVARSENAHGTKELSLREKIKVDRHSWIVARCGGPTYFDGTPHRDEVGVWRRNVMAHTSPIYLSVGGDWWMFDAGAADYLLTLLQGGIDYIHQRSPQWQPGTVTHHHGREDHLAFLDEPFRQAIDAIHARMHALGLPH